MNKDVIRGYVETFKQTVGCDNILLPGDPKFEKKCEALWEVVLNECDIDGFNAIALIDCGESSSGEANAVMLEEDGIFVFTGVDNRDDDGGIDWADFAELGLVRQIGENKIRIFEDDTDQCVDGPEAWLDFDVSHCGLSVDDAMKFFEGLLALVRENQQS